MSSYEDLLDRAGLTTLNLGRLRQLAIEIYKTINDQGPAYMKKIFITRTSKYNLRGVENLSLEKPRVNTATFGNHSLRFLGPQIWESLPTETRKAVNLREFKKLILTWEGSECGCNMCRAQ